MPRRKFIDKKTAQNFHLVYRAQNDPRIHDPDAPDMVFAEVAAPNTHKNRNNSNNAGEGSVRGGKIKSRHDLESEFGDRVRPNEGEAANYGIFYDDSEYDYMQHLRDMGGSGDATFIPAKDKDAEKKGSKGKMKLEDMLRGMTVDEDGRSEAGVSVSSTASSSAADLFGEDLAPSEFYRRTTYQDQQDVPDAIAGFQPDMDPRLREVLEALEDEAYVEDEDDIFNELAKDRQEVDPQSWEMMGDFLDDDDDGWATDDTVKADNKTKFEAPSPMGAVSDEGVMLPPVEGHAGEGGDDHGDGDWMAEFSKFKKDAKAQKTQKKVGAPSDLQSFVTGASSVTGGRHKKRKGALTSTSNYSMTSSALARTDQLSLLDERFEKYEQEYADDGYGADDNMSMASGMTGMSRMSGLSVYSKASTSSQAGGLRSDFDSILDEFSSKNGHIKRGKKQNGYKDGLAQLDEVRKGLGPARLKKSPKAY